MAVEKKTRDWHSQFLFNVSLYWYGDFGNPCKTVPMPISFRCVVIQGVLDLCMCVHVCSQLLNSHAKRKDETHVIHICNLTMEELDGVAPSLLRGFASVMMSTSKRPRLIKIQSVDLSQPHNLILLNQNLWCCLF